MNYQDYYSEVDAIAEALVSEAMAEHGNDAEQAMEAIVDSRLHETIDGHQWITYYNYNLSIIEHSSNVDYMIDNMGLDSAGQALQSGGLNGLHQAIAYWALYADVYELLQDKMDEYVDSLDTEEEEDEEE